MVDNDPRHRPAQPLVLSPPLTGPFFPSLPLFFLGSLTCSHWRLQAQALTTLFSLPALPHPRTGNLILPCDLECQLCASGNKSIPGGLSSHGLQTPLLVCGDGQPSGVYAAPSPPLTLPLQPSCHEDGELQVRCGSGQKSPPLHLCFHAFSHTLHAGGQRIGLF